MQPPLHVRAAESGTLGKRGSRETLRGRIASQRTPPTWYLENLSLLHFEIHKVDFSIETKNIHHLIIELGENDHGSG